MEQDRRDCLQRILESQATHKLIVSGPGTGKTYTFGKLLEYDPGESLVITLINNLVDEMQQEIGGLAEVRTFHSLSRKLLHKHPFGGITSRFHFFPKLTQVIENDSRILNEAGYLDRGFDKDALEEAFRLLNEQDGRVDFFIERANYYDAVGFDDSVYRVFSLFRESPEHVPQYHYVMVDEYQDFNALEVGLISTLEERNRMLIVGDDDQAIYHFRQASADHLRAKTGDPRYQHFPLPFCTRCTEVIVAAVQSIIGNAQNMGLLTQRLEKDFICYLPDKTSDNNSYPKIHVATCSVHRKNAPYISRYVESVIASIPAGEQHLALENEYPLALVVGESHYLKQIFDYLRDRFPNVVYRPSPNTSLTVLDGFILLFGKQDSNLAWRILVEFLSPNEFEELLITSIENGLPLIELIDIEFKAQQLSRVERIRDAIEGVDLVSDADIADLEEVLKLPFQDIITRVSESAQLDDRALRPMEEDIDQAFPTILLTTYNGCKGLSAGFTFVTGFEEGVFPDTNEQPTSTEVCQFIVALTRTRKQCHLIHTRMFAGNWTDKSIFLDWIPAELANHINVDKDFS